MASFGLGRSSAADSAPQTPIEASTPWMAASEGDLPLLQASLQTLNLTANAADEHGYTLVHAAASYNQIAILEFLIQQGAHVHVADHDGDTALHYAGGVPAAQFLVQQGIDRSQVNNVGKTALQAKQEDLEEMLQDEDMEDDDEDVETLKALVAYLSSLL